MNPKLALKKAAYRLGLDVRRAQPLPKSGDVPSFTDPFYEQARLLKGTNRPMIFDVGAHIGQTALKYKSIFPGASIYSFEPFEESFGRLKAAVKELEDVHPVKIALGKTVGDVALNVNRSTATSSLLPTDPRSSDTWNGTDVTDTLTEVKVSVETVDTFLVGHPDIATIDILKIDAQGSEMDILVGAEGALRAGWIRLVYLEIIMLPTYVGQRELEEYLVLFRKFGYTLHNLFNFCYTNDGQLNQLDALFVRGDASIMRGN